MPMTMKEAAEELIKIADAIEVEGDKVTKFVCSKCNHTATLADINAKRAAEVEEAKKAGQNVVASKVTVNDKIYCVACDGVMSYKADEGSAKYYFKDAVESPAEEQQEEHEKSETPAEEAKEEKEAGKKKEEEEEKKASEPIDYDSLQRYSSKSA